MKTLRDSAPEKWEYKEHTKVKHILLKKYLGAWLLILGKYNPKICYFDGFAGRGEYADGTFGSPLIALKVADELHQYFEKLICIFVEKDINNFENLVQILEGEKSNIEHLQKIEIKKENDEFAAVINRIFKYLENHDSLLVPSFFFIGPFGFSGIPFKIVKRILSNPKTEIFFTFMVRDISRFISHNKLNGLFTDLFGNDKWKDILNLNRRSPEIELINLYRENLHIEAGVNYSWAFRVCTSEKVQTLYYLICLSG